MSDFDRLQLDLISILINLSCELGQIMAIFDNGLISLLVNFLDELGQIMVIYHFPEAIRVI